MVRTTRGDDINAACGQLVGMVEDRTRRQSRYRERLAQQIPAVEVICNEHSSSVCYSVAYRSTSQVMSYWRYE